MSDELDISEIYTQKEMCMIVVTAEFISNAALLWLVTFCLWLFQPFVLHMNKKNNPASRCSY